MGDNRIQCERRLGQALAQVPAGRQRLVGRLARLLPSRLWRQDFGSMRKT